MDELSTTLAGLPALAAPAPIDGEGLTGFIDRFGPDLIDGWITDPANPSPPPEIAIFEGDRRLDTFVANIWRTDLQEIRQGDGRWGFTALPPAALADGRMHRVQLRLADGRALTRGELAVSFREGADRAALPVLRPPAWEPDPDYRPRPGPAPTLPGVDCLVSFVVVFYNMARGGGGKAASLSRAYQRGAEGIGYEVLCVDNGSTPALDRDWVEGFGPEFRLITAPAAPSPVAAINRAAREARGHHLAIMIDGAHVLSPGVLREAAEAVAESPDAVVSLRQWFVGGDQRFLARNGWTRAHEDMLFDRIGWPGDGYGLFRISTPVWESPNHWFDGMSESNCLFLPRALFEAIGGMDEAFDEPGAGYANLDLFRRAAEASPEPLVALVGEASFHQFHDGTTTNVDPEEKERRVRAYGQKYAMLREKPWVPLHAGSIRLRGQIRTRAALVARQRPLSPAQIGVTDTVRQAELSVHFDRSAREYLVSAYAEAGLQDAAQWRGAALGIAPSDAFEIADILHAMPAARVLAVHLTPGLRAFLRDVLAVDSLAGRLVVVGEDGIGGAAADPASPGAQTAIAAALGAATETLVLLGAGTEQPLLPAMLACAPFVSLRSYLIVVGSALGQPWLGYSRRWTAKAIHSFVGQAPFAIDETRTKHWITSCPLGFLQRIGPVEAGDDGMNLPLVGVS